MPYAIDRRTALYAPGGDPLGYPGPLPDIPLLIRDGAALPLTWRGGEWRTVDDDRPVDSLLRTPLRERTPQIAFGANRRPANLAWKMRHYRRQDPHLTDDLLLLPCTLPDAAVVACNVGYWGYVYAALLTAAHLPVLAGARCRAALLYLDQRQLHAVHASEGVPRPGDASPRPAVSCDVGAWPALPAHGKRVDAQFYALSLPFLSFDGLTPLPLAGVETAGLPAGWPIWTQTDLLDGLIQRLDLPLGPGVDGAALARQLHTLARHGQPPQPLFDRLWQGARDGLPLRDEAENVLRGNRRVPLLTPAQAWDGRI